jgi:chromosome segregation protein
MYLKELRMQGFKSFADQTLLALKPGVTAIVGPNGCGKSNIADALRWVLGEQSTKSLRADAMSDVIFQGSSKRKPLGLCEVSLVFADCEKILGTNFNELEIGRRVTREGSSDYFINGAKARLKDVQLLFLGTGVGQVSYSFLLQGRIDQILSSNPSERRAIFEEAAGISRYKTQRRDALDKLRGVEADLARVGDVLDEVSRRIGSLRRQASKAMRYKMLSERAGHLELALSAWERLRLARDIVNAEALVEGTRTRMLKSRSAIDKTQEQIARLREDKNRTDEKLREAQQCVYELRAEKDKALAGAETAAIRRQDHIAHLDAVKAELDDMVAERARLEETLRQRREIREKLLDLFGHGDGELDARAKALQEARRETEDAERELAAERNLRMEADGALARQRAVCARLGADLDAFQQRAAGISDELRQAAEELARERAEQEEFTNLREHLEGRRYDEEEAARLLKQKAAAAAEALRGVRQELRDAERGLDALNTRANMLDELQKRMEGFSDGAKAIAQGRLADLVPPQRCALLMEQMEVDDKWTGAVEMLLGTGIDAIALSDAADAETLRAGLTAKKLGKACLIIPPPLTSERADIPVSELSGGDALAAPIPALSAIRSRDAEHAPTLSALFADCWLFDTLADFLAWRQAHPDWSFRRAASLDGCAMEPGGMVFVGSGGESGQRDSFLRRQGQIRSMREDAERQQALLTEMGDREDEAATALQRAQTASEAAAQTLAATDQELATLRGQERGAGERIARARTRMDLRRQEQQKLEEARAQATQKISQADADLSALEASAASGRQSLAAMEEGLSVTRARTEELRESYEALRMEVSGKRQRLEIAHREVAETERMLEEWTLRHQKREADAARHAEQIAVLEREIEEQQALAARLEDELQQAHKLQEKRRDEASGAQRHVHALEQELSELRNAHDGMNEELTRQEVALVRLKSAMDFLAEEVEREHNLKIEDVDWREHVILAGEPIPERLHIGPDDDTLPDEPEAGRRPAPGEAEKARLDIPDWHSLKTQAKDCRERIDALGAINLLAIDEYRELRERHGFLKAQSDDLWQAREKLLAAIDEINRTSTELFRSTFEQIQVNFRYTFETLFGGGEANVELVDNGDLLESGVEITARPPGTRLRSVALLSGGQKTMTAMALLFAIYMVKPSPFCVLDEIDAPLDDANVGRFGNMLERFLEHSQFFIITHNKHTIAAADTIYGVTMEERGVSRVISMRMNRDGIAPKEAETVQAG